MAYYHHVVPHFHSSPISYAFAKPHSTTTRPPCISISSLRSLFNIFVVCGGDDFIPPFKIDHSFNQFPNNFFNSQSTALLVVVFNEIMMLEREIKSVDLV